MPTLEDAIFLATQLHKNQQDKAGKPYILHPLRVMLSMRTEIEQIVAVLHDVVEDCECTLEDLKNAGYSEKILQGVDALSKRKGELYEDYINRVKKNPIALRVKIADLEDNMSLSRFILTNEKDFKRLEKYKKTWEELQDKSSQIYYKNFHK